MLLLKNPALARQVQVVREFCASCHVVCIYEIRDKCEAESSRNESRKEERKGKKEAQ